MLDCRTAAVELAVARWAAERGWQVSRRSELIDRMRNGPRIVPSVDHPVALVRGSARAVLSQPYAEADVVPTIGTNLGPAPYGCSTVAHLITEAEWKATLR